MAYDLTPRPVTTTQPTASPQTAPSPGPGDDRSTAFRPVEAGGELQSGEKLLVEAYAAIWVVLFVMILLSWRRQKQIEGRIAHLDGAVLAAREAADQKKKKKGGA